MEGKEKERSITIEKIERNFKELRQQVKK